jgi:hypothetical protein
MRMHTLAMGSAIGLAVALVIAPPDAAGAPAVLTTPWPAELPCAQPSALWFDARLDGTLVWSSADGAETRSFVASKSSAKMREPAPRTK